MSRDPFANYDAWLERPYQDMMDESDRFVDWAEEYGYDLEDQDDIKRAEQGYQEYLEQMYEDWEISQYEDAMERRYEEMMEREYDDSYDYEYDY